ncbi:hypothetical protein [Massilia sp. MP_M2]
MNVKATIGRLRQHRARGEGIAPIGQAVNAHEAGVRRGQWQ